jgi:hypothetical protein
MPRQTLTIAGDVNVKLGITKSTYRNANSVILMGVPDVDVSAAAEKSSFGMSECRII